MGKIKITSVALADLAQDDKNARCHNKRNIAAIKSSLQKFNQYAPLVVQKSTQKILAGNGRYMAMRDLGWKNADCVIVDIDDKQAKALAIADNRTAELAEWDNALLADVLRDLSQEINLDDIGFDEYDLDAIVAKIDIPDLPAMDGDGAGTDENVKDEKKNKCPACGHEF